MQALQADKAEREAVKKARELAEAVKKESKLLYQDDEELMVDETALDPYETPRDYSGGADYALETALERDPLKPAKLRSLKASLRAEDAEPEPGAKVTWNSTASWNKVAAVKDATVLLNRARRFVDERTDPQEESAQVSAQPGAKLGRSAGAHGGARPQKKLEELELPPIMERIPYDTIEVLVNHENLWANLQGQNIASLSFNMDTEEERWLPFIEPLGLVWKHVGDVAPASGKGRQIHNSMLTAALQEASAGHAESDARVKFTDQEFSQFGIDAKEGLTRDDYVAAGPKYFMPQGGFEPKPFYSVGRIGPRLPPQRLGALRAQLYREIKKAYTSWRATRNLRTRWRRNLEAILEEGLATYEMAACSSVASDHRAVDKWRGRLLASLPHDHKFVGRAFTFSVTTPELIVDHIMRNYDYHEQGHKDVDFLFAVQCFPHYAAIASVWVYLGYIVPTAKAKGGGRARKGTAGGEA